MDIKKTRYNTVYFDTKNKTKQTLIKDKNSIFNIIEVSKSNLWAIISKMSADPNEIYGTNEERLLIYIPKKKIKVITDYSLSNIIK